MMMPQGLKGLTLCADDFGLDESIDRAILALIEAGRINAVSCMSGGKSWKQSAPILARAQSAIAIGLHLTFTELVPLGPMPRLAPNKRLPALGPLLRDALTHRLDFEEIQAECRRQVDEFTNILGRAPDHIDGHQHVHCFPIIRQSVLTMAEEYGCLTRNCATSFTQIIKGNALWTKTLAVNLAGWGFNRMLRARNISHNRQFFGLHDFSVQHDIGAMYRGWLAAADNDTLINCHPGEGAIANDALSGWRDHEYQFLMSENFGEMLQSKITRLDYKP